MSIPRTFMENSIRKRGGKLKMNLTIQQEYRQFGFGHGFGFRGYRY